MVTESVHKVESSWVIFTPNIDHHGIEAVLEVNGKKTFKPAANEAAGLEWSWWNHALLTAEA